MKEKKTFEKPEMKVVELKNNLLGNSASTCGENWFGSCDCE